MITLLIEIITHEDVMLLATTVKATKSLGLDLSSRSFGQLVDREIGNFNGMITRNGGRQLIGWFKRSILGLVDGRLGNYIGVIAIFTFWFTRLREGRGIKGVVLHMKTSQVLLMQAIGGDRVKNLSELKVRVKRSRQGLPLIIPVLHRRRIMAGDRNIIRLWNTLFSIYRVLEFPGVLKVDTITAAASSVLTRRLPDVLKFIPRFWITLLRKGIKDRFLLALTEQITFFPIGKSSPLTATISDPSAGLNYISSSWEAVHRAAAVWGLPHYDELREKLFKFALATGNISFSNIFNDVLRMRYPEHFVKESKLIAWVVGNSSKSSYSQYLINCKFKLPLDYFRDLLYEKDKKTDGFRPWEIPQAKSSSYHLNAYINRGPFIAAQNTIWDDNGPTKVELWYRDFKGWHVSEVVKQFEIEILQKSFKRYISEETLGKLGTKAEPAGKIRVYAMVDPWTQWLLAPLHKAVQTLLRGISQDGTFDQVKPILSLINKWESKLIDQDENVYSFDLSAATDRLPVSLQVDLLSHILGKETSANWASILVERDYSIKIGGVKEKLRYAVGQPMGALSSWVLLALTHHFIIQFAYYLHCQDRKIPYTWFENYAVLGDDMVVIGKSVAYKYLAIMKWLGVGIGLAKSIKAKKRLVLEFAKKFFVDGKNCSMVSFRDILVTSISTAVSAEFMRKHDYSLNSYLALRGLGYKARGSVTGYLWSLGQRLRVYLVFLSYPESVLGKASYVEWMIMRSISKSHDTKDIPWEKISDYVWDIWLNKYCKQKFRNPKAGLGRSDVEISRRELKETLLRTTTWQPILIAKSLGYTFDDWFHGKVPSGIIPELKRAIMIMWWDWMKTFGRVPDRRTMWWKGVTSTPSFYGFLPLPGSEIPGQQDSMIAATLREPDIWRLRMEIASWIHGTSLKTRSKAGSLFRKSAYFDREYFIPKHITASGTPRFFDERYLVHMIFIEYMWEMIRDIDRTVLTTKITLNTDFRTDETRFSEFLPLYHHWVAIQKLITKAAHPVPKQGWETKALVLYQAPSLALRIPVPDSSLCLVVMEEKRKIRREVETPSVIYLPGPRGSAIKAIWHHMRKFRKCFLQD